MDAQRRTPHGELLDSARIALGISQREAARRAGISEGRWRQVVTGVQRQGGVDIPVNPKASTVAAMARAVQADVTAVLDAAGLVVGDAAEESRIPTNAELAEQVDELRRLIDQLAGLVPQPPQEEPPVTNTVPGAGTA